LYGSIELTSDRATIGDAGVYAELNISLKSPTDSDTLANALKHSLGLSAIAPQAAVVSTPLVGYVQQAVGAASFPDGTVVIYFHLTLDEIMIYVLGKSIPQIKGRCSKVLKQVADIVPVRLKGASARIMIPISGTDVDILTGAKASWLNAFWASFKEKSLGKLVPSVVVAALAIYYFVPGAPAISSAVIALVATLVGVVMEAVLAARGTEPWKWKESQ
jgi:hypothetical protein